MSGEQKSNTLFEAVPALGSISAQGIGQAKLMPVGFEHPGFALLEGINRLGRDPGQSHHVILSSHVSRCHCEVVVRGGSIVVRDLGSHNGTWVNGERVTERNLRPGDKLGLSRRVMLMLVMDTEMQRPLGVMVNIAAPQAQPAPLVSVESPSMAAESHHSGSAFVAPAPVGTPPGGIAPVATSLEAVQPSPARRPSLPTDAVAGVIQRPPAAAGMPLAGDASLMDGEERELEPSAQIKQLEQQRNVLAILYQISLRCLLADNSHEAEKLIANVLQRLVPLESGFILYQTNAGWRASICPDSKARPSDETVQTCYQLAEKHRALLVLQQAHELQPLGLTPPRALLLAPLLLNGAVRGVIGAIAPEPSLFTASVVEITLQLANISAAALRDHVAGPGGAC